jgi:2,3-bisphosphoglycerate-dependent phosphoglycerate mutase
MKTIQRSYRLVLVRHGESTWNKENRFTGWTDVPLTPKGISEAARGGQTLKAQNFVFDQIYTSLLQRAINTMGTLLSEMSQLHVPVAKHWRLNERHYGSLQGLNKAETAAQHGEEKVLIWRRSYDVPPPALDSQDPRHPSHDAKYKTVPADVLPNTECLKDCVARVLPFWHDHIASDILQGKNVLVVAHGNSIRGLVKHLDRISDKDIVGLNIPTGVPLVYELTEQLKPVKSYYLLDEQELKAKMQEVANQGKKKP